MRQPNFHVYTGQKRTRNPAQQKRRPERSKPVPHRAIIQPAFQQKPFHQFLREAAQKTRREAEGRNMKVDDSDFAAAPQIRKSLTKMGDDHKYGADID